MSLTNIRTYFRERFDGLSYLEHEDGFNRQNIPQTILNKSYHILVESVTGGPINQLDQRTSSGVLISVFFKGYRNVNEAIDDAISNVEIIIKDVCKIANRTSMLLNVVFEGCDFLPLSDTNDNSVLVEMRFSADVEIGVEED